MAKAGAAQEPSMEEILASIRKIISDDGGATKAPEPARAAAPARPAAPADTVSEDDLDRLFAKSEPEPAPAPAPAPAPKAAARPAPPPPEPEELADDEPMLLDEADVLDLSEAAVVEDDLGIVEGLMPDEAEIVFAETSEMEPEPEPEPEIAEEPPHFEPEPVYTPPPPPPPRATRPAPRPAPPVEEEEEELVSAQVGASVNAAFGQLTHTILSANARTLDDLVKEMLRPMLKNWLDENLPVIVERLVRAEIERVSRGR